jgi:acyl transferase domain-containing protein
MMAVGIGAEGITTHLRGLGTAVQIACYNSPSSLTLSGTKDALMEVPNRLTEASKFVRMLHVDLAYHSTFMEEASHEYADLLAQDFEHLPFEESNARMFSSVTGEQLAGPTDSSYWQLNMTSPVRFHAALSKMLMDSGAPDFLIELGPTGALKGPTLQVLKSLPGIKAQYTSAMARGAVDMRSILEVVGRLHVAGGKPDLDMVNQVEGIEPKMVVDLPNYSWNHSTKYWYESEASKDWRNRLFPPHDLLGSKVLGSPWQSPSFMRSLDVRDLPWLADHKMGPDIVFPAAGFISMAIEAIYQRSEALHIREGEKRFANPQYKLRDVQFKRALVLPDDGSIRVSLTLTAHTGVGDWFEFKISSLAGTTWNEHVRGLVRTDEDVPRAASAEESKPLEHQVKASIWHKAMQDAGYSFGPQFLKQLEIESRPGACISRSILGLDAPNSKYAQSKYPMHPAVMDGCFQTCAPSLWNGLRHAVDAVLVPSMIDSLIITSGKANRGLSVTSSAYVGLGRPEDNKNYMSDAKVYDQESGNLLLCLSGLRYSKIDTGSSVYDPHVLSAVVSKPDLSLLSMRTLNILAERNQDDPDLSICLASEIVKLAAHKDPALSVLELNFVADVSESVWASSITGENINSRTYCRFVYRLASPKALVEAAQRYPSDKTETSLLDPESIISAGEEFDLVVVRLSPAAKNVNRVADQLKHVVKQGSHVLFLRERTSQGDQVLANSFDNGSYTSRSAGLTYIGHRQFPQVNKSASPSLYGVQAEADCADRKIMLHCFAEAQLSRAHWL